MLKISYTGPSLVADIDRVSEVWSNDVLPINDRDTQAMNRLCKLLINNAVFSIDGMNWSICTEFDSMDNHLWVVLSLSNVGDPNQRITENIPYSTLEQSGKTVKAVVSEIANQFNALLGIFRIDSIKPQSQWCSVCHTYHVEVGERTDTGALTRQCPLLATDDPRNVFANFPHPQPHPYSYR